MEYHIDKSRKPTGPLILSQVKCKQEPDESPFQLLTYGPGPRPEGEGVGVFGSLRVVKGVTEQVLSFPVPNRPFSFKPLVRPVSFINTQKFLLYL